MTIIIFIISYNTDTVKPEEQEHRHHLDSQIKFCGWVILILLTLILLYEIMFPEFLIENTASRKKSGRVKMKERIAIMVVTFSSILVVLICNQK